MFLIIIHLRQLVHAICSQYHHAVLVGRLTRYMPPVESEVVRVDTGIYEGGEVSMYYDPMIAILQACTSCYCKTCPAASTLRCYPQLAPEKIVGNRWAMLILRLLHFSMFVGMQ